MMFKFFQTSAMIYFLVMTSACGVQLRTTFCDSYLTEVPQEILGNYEVIATNISAEWSNNNILSKMDLKIDSLSFGTSLASEQGSSQVGLCKYNGRLFLESENNNGTYGLYELSNFQHGLILALFSLDVKQAQKNGYPLVYLPPVDFVADFSFKLNLSTLQEYILDNRQLSQEQTLKILKPITYQSILRTSRMLQDSQLKKIPLRTN